MRLKLPSDVLTSTRIFVVVIGVASSTWRHTRLLFTIEPPGTVTQVDPSQYWTWNAFSPKKLNVIVFVGSTGEFILSCSVKTLISSMVFSPLKSTSSQSGYTPDVPSHQPPPLPQFNPFRSPLIAAAAG